MRLQIGAMKKHNLRISLLRPLNCTVEGNSSSQLYESNHERRFMNNVVGLCLLLVLLAKIAVENGPTDGGASASTIHRDPR